MPALFKFSFKGTPEGSYCARDEYFRHKSGDSSMLSGERISHELNEFNESNSLNSFNSWLIRSFSYSAAS